MIESKFFAIVAIGTGATYLIAAMGDASTEALQWIGILGAMGTTAVGAYAAFRAAKHRADAADADLLQWKLKEAVERATVAEEQSETWRALYQAATGRTPAPPNERPRP